MTNFTLSPTFDAANASQKAELLLRRLGVRRNLSDLTTPYTCLCRWRPIPAPSS